MRRLGPVHSPLIASPDGPFRRARETRRPKPLTLRITKTWSLGVGAALGAVTLLALAPSMVAAQRQGDTADNAWPYQSEPKAPVLVAIGDISCQPDANSGLPGEKPKPNDTCSQIGTSDAQLRNQA